MDLEPGRLVAPNLRLVRLLKQGGMGSVWVAEHTTLGIEVAVKLMSPALLDDQAMLVRFRREALAAARIESPHVVRIFDHGVTDDGRLYLAMELLHGEELGARIKRAGPLNLRDAATVLAQTARGLSRAHEAGVVHRDIKPDNLFLTEIDGRLCVKILDFGVAKQDRPGGDVGVTTTGAMVGTPFYMSPEQLLSSKHVDYRSDLWSLAVVVYRALTGRVPFRGETLGALCVSVERGHFPPPSTLREGLPSAIDAWFLRAMARDPARRFGSAREMVDAFERAAGLQEATFQGAAITSEELARVRPTADRRIVLAIGAAGVALGTVAALFVFRGPSHPSGAEPPPVIVISTTEPDAPSGDASATASSPPTSSSRDTPSSSATVTPAPTASEAAAVPSSVNASDAASAPSRPHVPVVVDKHKKRGF